MKKFCFIFYFFSIISTLLFSEEKKSIEFWLYLTGERKEILYDLANKYEQVSGNKVKITWVPFDALQGKFIASAPQGKGPDVLIGPADWIGPFYTNNLIQDIKSYLTKEEEKKYIKSVIDNCKYKDGLYGLPIAYYVVALIYNKEMIKEPPKTTKDMIKIGLELTDTKNAVYGLAYDKTNYYYHFPWVGGFGEKIIDENYNPTFNKKGQIDAAKFVHSLQKGDSLIMPDELDYNMMMTLFRTKKAAMILNGPWVMSQVEGSGVDYGVTRIPIVSVTGKWPSPAIGAEIMYLSSKSNNKNIAYDFIKFMVSSDSQALLAKYGYLPSKEEVYDYKSVNQSPYFKHIKEFRKQAEVGTMMPVAPEMNVSIWAEGISMLGTVFGEEMTAEDACELAQKNAQTSIDEWRKSQEKK